MKKIYNILIILIVKFAISGLFNDSFNMFNSPLAVMGNIVDDNVIVVAATKSVSYKPTDTFGTLPEVTKSGTTFIGWYGQNKNGVMQKNNIFNQCK